MIDLVADSYRPSGVEEKFSLPVVKISKISEVFKVSKVSKVFKLFKVSKVSKASKVSKPSGVKENLSAGPC